MRILTRRPPASRDAGHDGFTLIEVMVSLGLLSIVAASLMPFLVGTVHASVAAKWYGQAKNLAQQQVESMRNLVYHIDANRQVDLSGADQSTKKLDLLDNYFPNLTAASAVGATSPLTATAGYVSTAGTRFTGEPSGPFYRWTSAGPVTLDHEAFNIVVDTQFLTPGASPSAVTPPSGYSYSDESGQDAPPATLVGVTVTVAWRSYGALKQQQTYTRIDESQPARPTVRVQARAALLHVEASLEDGTSLASDVASVDTNGSTSTGTTAAASALGATASDTPGSTINGAQSSLSAPPSGTMSAASDANGADLSGSGCSFICFGKTAITGGPVSVSGGVPTVGSLAGGGAPITAALLGYGASGRSPFSFSDNQNNSDLGLASSPVVSVGPVGSGTPQGGAGGGLYATSGTGHIADAQASACFNATPCSSGGSAAAVVQVMPTTFAPQGVVQLALNYASLECQANGVSPITPTASYSATVYYWNGSGYAVLGTIRPSNASDPLPTPTQMATMVVGTVNGVTKHLSDYIASWGDAPFNQHLSTGADGNTATGSVDGVVSLVTQPTRSDDPSSGVGVKLGILSCFAEDAR